MTAGALPASREWSLPATAENVSRARRIVAEHLRELGVPEQLLDTVRVGVSEAFTNAVLHAYIEAPGPGSVHVTAGVGDDEVCVTVSDDGRGMVPRHDSPGAGLGLAIIAQIATGVEIGHSPSGGTVVRMSFSG